MKGCVLTAAVILLTVTALCFAGGAHDRGIWDNAKLIRPGMSAGQVQQIVGKPSWTGRCGVYVSYGASDGCAAELGYGSAFSPLLPKYWVVQLDKQQQVIATTDLVSP